MKSLESIEETLRRLGAHRRSTANPGPALDERILADGQACLAEHDRGAMPGGIWARLASPRGALAGVAATIIVGTLVVVHWSSPAWALSEAIEALRPFRAVHMVGYGTGLDGVSQPMELWARANAEGTQSGACLARTDDMVAWVDGAQTYYYFAAQNKVVVDPGIMIGLHPWCGPELLEMLSEEALDCRIRAGVDPVTGHGRIVVTGGMDTAFGPQSWRIEFDESTSLPIRMQQWSNRKRQGAPVFSAETMIYFEDLPDSDLVFEVPPGVPFEKKPLTIPEENLALMATPDAGIAVDGRGRDEACRKLLGEFWAAAIQGDLARMRTLCPILERWDDKLVRMILDQEGSAVELLEIGPVIHEGASAVGPLALVPSRVRSRDGLVREVRILVQFRHGESGTTCLVHGKYGQSRIAPDPDGA